MKYLIMMFYMMLSGFLIVPLAYGAQLAIVMDDFGYRTSNEKQVILLSSDITVAVLPNSSNAASIATFAYQNGNEVIIHLPMAPIGKQQLEVDTLNPAMAETEINRIIAEAVEKVPYAIGMNNHMGSLMTSDLAAMEKVMKNLSSYSLFFLDSRTIAESKAVIAAKNYRVPVVSRNVFLDDSQDELSISQQFDLAVKYARKHGNAVLIGHPYSSSVNVLTEKLANLPNDVELVKLSTLVQQVEKIDLRDLLHRYKVKMEQRLLQYLILTQLPS